MHPAEIASTSVSDLPDPLPEDVVVLDVREQHEWDAGHIAGAVHIPLRTLPDQVAQLDPQVRTVVVCHVGGRSAQATAWLAGQGYDVVNLNGGMEAWEAAGRPIEV